MSHLQSYPLVLASESPRRRQLLEQAGYSFDIIPSQVDESAFNDTMVPEVYVQMLAQAKAQEVAQRYPDHWVLGADTVIDFEGQIIGKPRDATHAEAITRKIFSQPHRVITGVALICVRDGLEQLTAEVTIVYPRPLSNEQVAAHIRGGTWQGKAGAYAIQETGDQLIERLEGSLTNVIGLPMEWVGKQLPLSGFGA